MEVITSRANQHLKYAGKVACGRVEMKFLAEGLRLVNELLESRIPVESVLLSPETNAAHPEIQKKADERGASLFLIEAGLFSAFSTTKTPQTIAAIGLTPSTKVAHVLRLDTDWPAPLVVLHRVSNPGNLGSVARVAEAAGTPALITTADSVDPFNPRALRGSMGSIFRLPVVQGLPFDSAIKEAKRIQLRTVGTSANSETSIYDYDWDRPVALILGSEASGLSESEAEIIDDMVRIPMAGHVESLNLAVSAGIVLYEAARGKIG